jgi:anti-anti-sigma factor
MEIRVDAVGDVSVVFIDGNVLQENASVLRKKLLDLIEEGKIKIILDMIASNYISSICLATIADVKKKVNDLGGNLKLAQPNKLIRNLLEETNFIQIIEIFDNVDAAVKSFSLQS